MALKLEVGKTYLTRRGEKALVGMTNLPFTDCEDQAVGVIIYKTSGGTPFCKTQTWFPDGMYYGGSKIDDRDLVSEWIDPVYNYTPILKSGPLPVFFKDYDEACNEGAKVASSENPLLGMLRYDETRSDKNLLTFKLGEKPKE